MEDYVLLKGKITGKWYDLDKLRIIILWQRPWESNMISQ